MNHKFRPERSSRKKVFVYKIEEKREGKKGFLNLRPLSGPKNENGISEKPFCTSTGRHQYYSEKLNNYVMCERSYGNIGFVYKGH